MKHTSRALVPFPRVCLVFCGLSPPPKCDHFAHSRSYTAKERTHNMVNIPCNQSIRRFICQFAAFHVAAGAVVLPWFCECSSLTLQRSDRDRTRRWCVECEVPVPCALPYCRGSFTWARATTSEALRVEGNTFPPSTSLLVEVCTCTSGSSAAMV